MQVPCLSFVTSYCSRTCLTSTLRKYETIFRSFGERRSLPPIHGSFQSHHLTLQRTMVMKVSVLEKVKRARQTWFWGSNRERLRKHDENVAFEMDAILSRHSIRGKGGEETSQGQAGFPGLQAIRRCSSKYLRSLVQGLDLDRGGIQDCVPPHVNI